MSKGILFLLFVIVLTPLWQELIEKFFEWLEQNKLRESEELNKTKPIIKKYGRYTKMREVKVKEFLKDTKKWLFFKLTDKEDVSLCESIGLLDQKGQDLYTGDIVLIENNIIYRQFKIVFNKQELAFGFENEKKEFFTLKEIKGIFENYTITKVGNIFNR